jgi:hypothetical protein
MENNNQERTKRSPRRIASRIGHIFSWGVIGLVFICLFALGFGFVVKWLWNTLLPALFDFPEITFWQAFGLVILAKLLFGSFGSPRHDRKDRYSRSYHHDWHAPWRASGEERESMKSKFRNWKAYHRFWEDEGKAAFKAYMERKEKEGHATSTEESGAPKESKPDSSMT